jgi:hypothetical protein
MEQISSWQSNGHSASQKIPRLLRNPIFYYRVYKSPPLVSILGQTHSVQTLPPYHTKTNPNIIFLSTHRSSFRSRFSDQNFECDSLLSHACYIHCPSHIALIMLGEECIHGLINVTTLSCRHVSEIFRLSSGNFMTRDVIRNTVRLTPVKVGQWVNVQCRFLQEWFQCLNYNTQHPHFDAYRLTAPTMFTLQLNWGEGRSRDNTVTVLWPLARHRSFIVKCFTENASLGWRHDL